MPNTQTFKNFAKLLKKTQTPEKFELLDKAGFQFLQIRKVDSSLPPANPHS